MRSIDRACRCFDKTGTLTFDDLAMEGVQPVRGDK
jgi:magnesium-transporting ATPase (P-type)